MTAETSPASGFVPGVAKTAGRDDRGGRSLAAVVLAAGFGTRLQPLTLRRPKPLCPVANVALVDHAIDRVAVVTDQIAVNIHAGRAQMERHFRPPASPVQLVDEQGVGGVERSHVVQLSFEEPAVLGTAGALGRLGWWIDGRSVLVVNGDTWVTAPIGAFVQEWDGERVAVLLHDPPATAAVGPAPAFAPTSRLAATLLPWHEVRTLEAVPSGLYERCLAPAATEGRLQAIPCGGAFFDCGTPGSYLAANLAAVGSRPGSIVSTGARVTGSVDDSVVGDSTVEGSVSRSVVWSAAVVHRGEALADAIRTDTGETVLVR